MHFFVLEKIIHLTLAVMPRRFPRICPLCEKPRVVNLSSHLEIVHGITGLRRTQLLKEFIGNPRKRIFLQASYLVVLLVPQEKQLKREKEHDQ